MKHDTARHIVAGDSIELHVVEFNGKPVFETEFVQYDSELRVRDLEMRGIGEFDFRACDELDEEYIDGKINFRSVRIFHLAANENMKFVCGNTVKAKITSAYIAKGETKDGRRKIHIIVSDIMRIYRWARCHVSTRDCLVIMLCCGERLIKEKTIPLTLKNGIQVKHGMAYPVIAEVLPNGSILRVSPDYRRYQVTTGDYRLVERQKGRTMKDIDSDFLRIPPYDRMIPIRDRKYRVRCAVHI